jgi:tetratricopeptide (TPR) repeat protein
LGRCYRAIGKYEPAGRDEHYRLATEALGRSLELHPDLPSAHYYLAQLELDRGRVSEALDRLLGVVEASPNDPSGWVGLVSAFRYVGLLDESRAAHARARALDPEVPTSIHYTLASLGLGDDLEHERFPDSLAAIEGWVLARAGREVEAIARLARAESADRGSLAGTIARLYRAALEGDRDSAFAASRTLDDFPDPEGRYLHGSMMARGGWLDRAVEILVDGIDGGYANVPWFARDPWLDPVREDPRLRGAMERAEAVHRAGRAAYGGKVR